MSHVRRLALILPLAGLACSPSPRETAPSAAPTGLTAALAERAHINLRWQNRASDAGGSVVEFKMGRDEDFGVLAFASAESTEARHPDVAPDTAFTYRIRPIFGEASDETVFLTGPSSTTEEAPPCDEGPLERETSPMGGPGPKSALRAAATRGGGRPTALTAVLPSPFCVELRWQDRASDEEGYLVELRDEPRDFRVVAMLPPNTTTFRKPHLPPNTRCHFRVRAYTLGNPSNTATVVTPKGYGQRPAANEP